MLYLFLLGRGPCVPRRSGRSEGERRCAAEDREGRGRISLFESTV